MESSNSHGRKFLCSTWTLMLKQLHEILAGAWLQWKLMPMKSEWKHSLLIIWNFEGLRFETEGIIRYNKNSNWLNAASEINFQEGRRKKENKLSEFSISSGIIRGIKGDYFLISMFAMNLYFYSIMSPLLCVVLKFIFVFWNRFSIINFILT